MIWNELFWFWRFIFCPLLQLFLDITLMRQISSVMRHRVSGADNSEFHEWVNCIRRRTSFYIIYIILITISQNLLRQPCRNYILLRFQSIFQPPCRKIKRNNQSEFSYIIRWPFPHVQWNYRYSKITTVAPSQVSLYSYITVRYQMQWQIQYICSSRILLLLYSL